MLAGAGCSLLSVNSLLCVKYEGLRQLKSAFGELVWRFPGGHIGGGRYEVSFDTLVSDFLEGKEEVAGTSDWWRQWSW